MFFYFRNVRETQVSPLCPPPITIASYFLVFHDSEAISELILLYNPSFTVSNKYEVVVGEFEVEKDLVEKKYF